MLSDSLETIKGIGKTRAKAFAKLGINSIFELISFLPRKYMDLTKIAKINQMVEKNNWFGEVEIISEPRIQRLSGGLSLVKATAADETGSIVLAWYNQPYMAKNIKRAEKYFVFGKPELRYGQICIYNPMYERVADGLRDHYIPVYRATSGLSQTIIRNSVKQCLQFNIHYIEDVIPEEIRRRYDLCNIKDAYRFAHFPPDMKTKDRAVKTLAFEEILMLKSWLGSLKKRSANAIALTASQDAKKAFIKRLGFKLTDDQQHAITQIESDMAKETPMARLLQGDVGSGKTAVAAFCLYLAAVNKMQGALMAPTEILAEQHYWYMIKLFRPFGIKVGLLKSGLKKIEREEVLKGVQEGTIDILVGTHALIGQAVEFKNLSVIIADEQHRFGIMQRAELLKKSLAPHALFLSATPIPRTLALILYGDLDISTIEELPPGRKRIITRLVPSRKRKAMYKYLHDQIIKGTQAYIVCPVIDTEDERISTTKLFNTLTKAFPDIRFGVLHGKLKPKEKTEIMNSFKEHNIDALISTTVVEVGIDVPNASFMVIENAERFGLAQLHQLRGRVGRGNQESWCFLVTDEISNKRLEIICTNANGFDIAKEDLELRGPGDVLGTRQHGLPTLKFASFLSDSRILEQAQEAYEYLVLKDQASLQKILKSAKVKYDSKYLDKIIN